MNPSIVFAHCGVAHRTGPANTGWLAENWSFFFCYLYWWRALNGALVQLMDLMDGPILTPTFQKSAWKSIICQTVVVVSWIMISSVSSSGFGLSREQRNDYGISSPGVVPQSGRSYLKYPQFGSRNSSILSVSAAFMPNCWWQIYIISSLSVLFRSAANLSSTWLNI